MDPNYFIEAVGPEDKPSDARLINDNGLVVYTVSEPDLENFTVYVKTPAETRCLGSVLATAINSQGLIAVSLRPLATNQDEYEWRPIITDGIDNLAQWRDVDAADA